MLKREKKLLISMSEVEMNILKKLAEYEGGLSLSGTIRHLIILASRERGLLNSTNNYKGENINKEINNG
jgi:hypothetical protein